MKKIRRSLTISEENDKKIQSHRAMFLNLTNPVDFDYTTMVNILIEIGNIDLKQKNVDVDKMIKKYKR